MANMCSLHGLPRSLEAEDLEHYVEGTTNTRVRDILFGQASGVALVVFEDNIGK